jgi:hypothetical protein
MLVIPNEIIDLYPKSDVNIIDAAELFHLLHLLPKSYSDSPHKPWMTSRRY